MVEWRECITWMVDIGFLSPDHELTEKYAELRDLAFFLRDGVVLCHLINKIVPGCLDRRKFSPLPQSQFSSANNLRTFQECCSKVFQIPISFHFDSNKFARLDIMWKVLKFLAELSRRSEALTGVLPFSVKSSNYYNFKPCPEEKQCKYGYLRMEDDTYLNVMNIFEQNRKKRPEDLLQRCVDELLDTERNYNSVLSLIDDKFLEPLKSVLDEKNFKMIFSEIKPLLKIHKSFYEELLKSTEKDCVFDIADVFIKFKEKFLIYGHYCKKLKSVLDLLELLKTSNESFKAHLQLCETSIKSRSFKLHEYLTVPMQRVLKYPLLLKEMLKQSKGSQTRSFEKAIEEAEDLACYVNEVARDHDIMTQIQQLQTRINGLPSVDLKSFGRTVKDGEVRVKKKDAKAFKMRHLFLFDKKLIICKPKKNGNFMFRELHDTKSFKSADVQNSPGKKKFRCVVERCDGMKDFILSSKLDLSSWAAAFNEAKDNSSPKHSDKPNRYFQLNTFTDTKICDVCKKLLRGLFFQGYYCEEDDISSHKECLAIAQHIDKRTNCLPKPLPKQLSKSCANMSSYINSDVENQPWYLGRMSRELSFKLLSKFPESTFMVRESTSGEKDYCINIKYSGNVQNIKIYHKNGKFFLSDIRKFSNVVYLNQMHRKCPTIYKGPLPKASQGWVANLCNPLTNLLAIDLVELVSFYESNSLQTIFRQINSHLAHPISESYPLYDESTKFCKALSTTCTGKIGWLDLEEGDIILVVEELTDGIWFGFLKGEVGMFERKSVEVVR